MFIIDQCKEGKSDGRWFGPELTVGSRRFFHVVKGLTHDYLALENDSAMTYLVSEFYAHGAEHGIRRSGTAFDILRPPGENLIISEKDRTLTDLTSVQCHRMIH
jgi:dTDP-4-dehydrorhamnose 3,5-epimerase-like enzyme